jgi:general secretion pathway protein F/type IV pilus assembly protein PilC
MALSGQKSHGTFTANSEREVLAMLDSRGLFPVRVAPAKAAGGFNISFGGRRVASKHMTAFYSQLADLLHSGVPLLRSLDILERQSTQPALTDVLKEVRAKVADGTSLADSMSAHPRIFGELSVSMIRAGQEGGFLEDVLRRIADFTENQEDLKSKVIGALAYPVFLAVVGFLVLNILVIFFVPQFKDLFKKLDEANELPTLTKALIATSNFMRSWGGLAIGVAGIGGFIGFRAWAATPRGRLLFDSVKLRIPLAGPIYLSYALARFTRVLGTLLHNGIPILQSLRISKDSTGNKVLTAAIEQSAENITGGDALAEPLRACKYFPRDIVEMIAVGEESNNLDKVLVDIANALEKRTSRQLDLFVRLLEPMMLLVMAGITLTVVSGLLLPVFKMSKALK